MRYSTGVACREALDSGEISGSVPVMAMAEIPSHQSQQDVSPELQAELDNAMENLGQSEDESGEDNLSESSSEEPNLLLFGLQEEPPTLPSEEDADDGDDGPGYFGDEDEESDGAKSLEIGPEGTGNDDSRSLSDSSSRPKSPEPNNNIRESGSKRKKDCHEVPENNILDNFKGYCRHARHNYVDLKPEFVAGIQLWDILDRHSGSIGDLYDQIYNWHLSNLDASTRVTRDALMKRMTTRYNLKGVNPNQTRVELPASKARVDLTWHNFQAQLVDLLVDPRIKETDYLFHDNNPFSPPPAEFESVNDINTGLSYRETYNQLIRPAPFADNGRRKVLLPIIMYMDGTISGQFANLPIEQLKFTVGIFNRETRSHEHAWRIIGYINNYLPEDTRAKDMMAESKHMDKDGYYAASEVEVEAANPRDIVNLEDEYDGDDDDDGENNKERLPDPDDIELEEKKVPECDAQDLHTMMDKLLVTYREVQEEGLDWDLCVGDKVYHVHFVLYLALIKGDTQEHDKLCGKYTSRGKEIKHLCRYCLVPNEETDDPQVDYPRKTQSMIEALIEAEDKDALQNMSQQLIHNAMYKIRCAHLTKDHEYFGVHGICPAEGLHYVQIGKYAYLRGEFFECIGKTSEVAKLFNAHARNVGVTLHRQSDRDKPRTMFSKGLMKGKVMAHEMRGVILVILASIRTSKGRNILMNNRGKAKNNFGTVKQLKDWCTLLQLWLQYEAWMNKEDGHRVHYVDLLKEKIRDLLQLEIDLAPRSKGMGNKLFNFHASLHVAQDILDHGSPNNTNTRPDEMNHKSSKKAAKHTQKIPEKFDYQIAARLHERHILNLARSEVDGNPIWEYFSNKTIQDADILANDDDLLSESNEDDGNSVAVQSDVKRQLGGTKVIFYFEDGNTTMPRYKVLGRGKNKQKFVLDEDLVSFLAEILEKSGLSSIKLYTEQVRENIIFRGSPHCFGRPWRDWCIVRWNYDKKEESSVEEIPSSDTGESDDDSSECESVQSKSIRKPAKRIRIDRPNDAQVGKINDESDTFSSGSEDENQTNDKNTDNDEDDEADYEDLPFHIMCFVDLRDMEEGMVPELPPDVYACGESAFKRSKNRQNRQVLELTNMFTSYTKEIRRRENASGGIQRQVYLTPVDAIVDTAILIPDTDHDNCAEYLMMTPRRLWPNLFEQWLEGNG